MHLCCNTSIFFLNSPRHFCYLLERTVGVGNTMTVLCSLPVKRAFYENIFSSKNVRCLRLKTYDEVIRFGAVVMPMPTVLQGKKLSRSSSFAVTFSYANSSCLLTKQDLSSIVRQPYSLLRFALLLLIYSMRSLLFLMQIVRRIDSLTQTNEVATTSHTLSLPHPKVVHSLF